MAVFRLFIVTLYLALAYGFKDYNGYQIWSLKSSCPAIENLKDVKILRHDKKATDLLIPPNQLKHVSLLLEAQNVAFVITNNDVGLNVMKERQRLQKNRLTKNPVYDYNEYQDLSTIEAELRNVSQTRCPAGFTCQVNSLGQTHENRNITISKSGAGRRAIWIDATIHAREWIATATNMKIINKLVSDYNSDNDVKRLMDTYDWHLLPVMNPDGYVHTWDVDRYWRKNRRPNSDTVCPGVDLNRNYDQWFFDDGASSEECSDVYGGPSAGSELETAAIQTEARQIGSTLLAWVSLHSYSNYWLHPDGRSDSSSPTLCQRAADHDDMFRVAQAAATATENTNNEDSWTPGNWCEVLYAATGNTQDYAKYKGGVKYTFTPELRGTDFAIGPENIDPSFNEVWNGVKAMINAIENPSK